MSDNITKAKERATVALDALREKIGGRRYYAWAGYWHPAGWTELVWNGQGWDEITTSPKSRKETPELRLTVIIEGTREYVCQGVLIEEGPVDATTEPSDENAGSRG